MTIELPTVERLHELIVRFRQGRVAMWVDLVADRYISGIPKRISREAPVLILRKNHEQLVPGGGANAIANVAALGGHPLPVGFVGDDRSGKQLLAALAEQGITTDGIIQRPGSATPTKTRILAGGRHAIKQQVVRFDEEAFVEPTAAEVEQLLAKLREWREWRPIEVVVLSDYGYGAVDPALTPRIRKAIGDGRVLADSRYRLEDFEDIDGATPNAEEAAALVDVDADDSFDRDDASFAQAVQTARAQLGADFLLVTRGSTGMSLYEPESVAHLPVHGTDQVADVTGAGDTVIGTFALALAAGGSALEAACLADYSGGIVVMKSGTATVSAEELHDAVSTNPRLLESLVFTAMPRKP